MLGVFLVTCEGVLGVLFFEMFFGILFDVVFGVMEEFSTLLLGVEDTIVSELPTREFLVLLLVAGDLPDTLFLRPYFLTGFDCFPQGTGLITSSSNHKVPPLGGDGVASDLTEPRAILCNMAMWEMGSAKYL